MTEGVHRGARRRSYSSLQYTANWSMMMAQAAWMHEGVPEVAGHPMGKRIWTADFRTSSSIASGMYRKSLGSNRIFYATGKPNSVSYIPARMTRGNGSMNGAMSS